MALASAAVLAPAASAAGCRSASRSRADALLVALAYSWPLGSTIFALDGKYERNLTNNGVHR